MWVILALLDPNPYSQSMWIRIQPNQNECGSGSATLALVNSYRRSLYNFFYYFFILGRACAWGVPVRRGGAPLCGRLPGRVCRPRGHQTPHRPVRAHWQYCPLQCGHKQRFHLQGLASQNAWFKMKPADFSAFWTCSVTRCPQAISSSTMWSLATFPASRFSLSKCPSNWLIFLLLWTFTCSKHRLVRDHWQYRPLQCGHKQLWTFTCSKHQPVRAHWQYCHLQWGHQQRFHLQGLASQNALFLIIPADFLPFVNLYLFRTLVSMCPLTISSSTMQSQAMLPPARFSPSKHLFLKIKPADFSAYVDLHLFKTLQSICLLIILSSTMRS